MTDTLSDESSRTPDVSDAPTTPSADRSRLLVALGDRDWRHLSYRALIAYVISRICVVAGAAVVAAQRVVQDRFDGIARPTNAIHKITDVLTSWDGKWYFAIIRDSYPSHVPAHVTFDDYQARTAFFPVYPAIVRWADKILPGSDVFAGLFVNLVLGAAAVLLVGVLARNFFDDRVAYRSMLLVALFPGSFVLSFTYSEATLIVVAAACLLCLQHKQWLAAGILASIGGATRANGIALIAACGVAALIAIVQDRRWRSLIAPAIAPIGFVGFHLFLWRRTGEKLVWFRTQSEAWHEGTSFGVTALRNTVDAFTRPLSSPTDIITAVSFISTLILVYMAYRKRLPWPVAAYTFVVLVLMLSPSTVTARPRFLYTAFPLLISAAAWIVSYEDNYRQRHTAAEGSIETAGHGGELWIAILCIAAAGLVALTALYGVFGAIP